MVRADYLPVMRWHQQAAAIPSSFQKKGGRTGKRTLQHPVTVPTIKRDNTSLFFLGKKRSHRHSHCAAAAVSAADSAAAIQTVLEAARTNVAKAEVHTSLHQRLQERSPLVKVT
jgi:hypothetical protein